MAIGFVLPPPPCDDACPAFDVDVVEEELAFVAWDATFRVLLRTPAAGPDASAVAGVEEEADVVEDEEDDDAVLLPPEASIVVCVVAFCPFLGSYPI